MKNQVTNLKLTFHILGLNGIFNCILIETTDTYYILVKLVKQLLSIL